MNLSAAWFIGQWARDPCEEIKRWKMAITRSKLSERERIRFDSFAWKIIRLYVRYFVEQKKKKKTFDDLRSNFSIETSPGITKKIYPVQSHFVIEFEWTSFFRVANGWILVDYVTICHMAQYRCSHFFLLAESGKRGREREKEKTRKRSNIIHAGILVLYKQATFLQSVLHVDRCIDPLAPCTRRFLPRVRKTIRKYEGWKVEKRELKDEVFVI